EQQPFGLADRRNGIGESTINRDDAAGAIDDGSRRHQVVPIELGVESPGETSRNQDARAMAGEQMRSASAGRGKPDPRDDDGYDPTFQLPLSDRQRPGAVATNPFELVEK